MIKSTVDDNGHAQIPDQQHHCHCCHFLHQQKPIPKCLPKRIILVRHGESEGNKDDAMYTVTPDYRIPLTPKGIGQAKEAGSRIFNVVSDNGTSDNWKVYFYVSPYVRTRSTLREIGRAFSRRRVLGVREECRIREQDFGNFQVAERMKVIKETRERFGRFFYRFPEGESAADVYDRVSSKILFSPFYVVGGHLVAD
ncbi:phosphoglycerate mutase-like protein AT74 [Lycium ferocissimum]|uniref:phosphoglycerate mutase-like protein AT74 n=1 Tax=Lycium ferocissimum TaxID=112874 RepID=UPI0028165BED|nr:phosphoglycerate mutase-like protein AT74 [Lycium ferocissimum]